MNKDLLKDLFLEMRPYQWIKGIFIFLPIIFGKMFFNTDIFIKACWIFLGFNLVSSAVYILNDIVDLKSDQAHPHKSQRPLAAGQVTPAQAGILGVCLCVAGLMISFFVDINIVWIVLLYLLMNILYIYLFKHVEIIDVFCIALFYYFRIHLGGMIAGVVLSNWIILCTCLLALFLGFNKRKGELILGGDTRPVLRKYNDYFIDRMISIIATSMVVIYAVYVMDAETILRMGSNRLLYTIPFVYYGIFRYIYLIDTHALKIGGDPITILYRDWKLQLNVLLWIGVCISVIYF